MAAPPVTPSSGNPIADFLVSYLANIATELTMRLLDAVTGRVMRKFQAPPREQALQAALKAALLDAAKQLPHLNSDHEIYLELFGEFVKREAVVEELKLLVEPLPGRAINQPLLYGQFLAAGFEAGYLTPIAFNSLTQTLVSSFYSNAAKSEELQGAIEINLLHQLVQMQRDQLAATTRTADATESSASSLIEITKLMAKLDDTLSNLATNAPGVAFDTYVAVANELGKSYRYVTIEADGSLKLAEPLHTESLDKDKDRAAIEPLRKLLEDLRNSLVRPSNQPAPEELHARETRYRQLLIAQYHDLTFEVLSSDLRPIRLSLEDIYVELRAISEVPDAADDFSAEERRYLLALEEAQGKLSSEDEHKILVRMDARRRERWAQSDKMKRFPIREALSDPQQRGLVILGDPGSGKSTLLHFLALAFAQGPQPTQRLLNISGDDCDRLPIFVSLAAYDDMLNQQPELTVREFLARFYDRKRATPGLEPVFEHALTRGRALILLDGMDEVVHESRRRIVAEQIDAFVRSVLPEGNRVIVTSRIYGYRAARLSTNLPHVTVLDFRREDRALFARQWSRAKARWDAGGTLTPHQELMAQDKERELLDDIDSNPGVDKLASNPLMLTMLALLRDRLGQLPERRISLYDEYVKALVERWEEVRSRGARNTAPRRTDVSGAAAILIPLSFWLQENEPSGTASQAVLLTQLQRIYVQKDELGPELALQRAEAFLEDMRKFSGLLIERGHNQFGFRHLTFQEYFAGRELARMPAADRWQKLLPNLHANRWREPFLLSVAHLSVFENRYDEVSKLVEQVLDAHSDHEAELHRDALLAADCATDDVGLKLPTLRRIVEQLAPLIQSRVPAIAIAATQRLCRLALLKSGEQRRLPEAGEALRGVTEALTRQTQDAMLKALHPVWLQDASLFPGLETWLLISLINLTYLSSDGRTILAKYLSDSTSLRAKIVERFFDTQPYIRAEAVNMVSPLLKDDGELRAKVIEMLTDTQPEMRIAAVRALTPFLKNDSELRARVAGMLADEDSNVQIVVVRALSPLLKDDRELRVKVAEKMDDMQWHVQMEAVIAVSELLKDDRELRVKVTEMLTDEQSNVRTAVVNALGPLLKDDRELQARVVEKLDDMQSYVRVAVIEAVSPLLKDDAELRAKVVKMLADEQSSVRKEAMERLIKYWDSDDVIRKAITQSLYHSDWNTRRDTVACLHDAILSQESLIQIVLGQFSNLLGLASSAARAASVSAMSKLLRNDDELRAKVVGMLTDERWNVRAAAVSAVSVLLKDDSELRAKIVERLADEDNDVRAAAVNVLSPFLKHDGELRARVIEMIAADELSNVRVEVVSAISPLLEDDAELRAKVADMIADEHWNVRVAAVNAISVFLEDDHELRKKVMEMLADEDNDVRVAAVNAISAFLKDDRELRTKVMEMLADEDSDARIAAMSAISVFLKDDYEFRTKVVEMLTDENSDVRATTVNAICVFLKDDRELRTKVTEMLADEDSDVRATAVNAISPFLKDDGALRAKILELLANEQWNVRTAVASAISPFLKDDPVIRKKLWVIFQLDNGVSDEQGTGWVMREMRKAFITAVAEWVQIAPQNLDEVIALLSSPDSRICETAAQVIEQAGIASVQAARTALMVAMDDRRETESWPARIACAEVLLNHHRYSQQALDTILPALDHGTRPLGEKADSTAVRQQAALALGNLKAAYRDPRALNRLARLINEDKNPQVLDAAYSALLSLVSAPEVDEA